jgi:uncharacterized membrane protein
MDNDQMKAPAIPTRDTGVDLLRSLAVLLMVLCHTVRGIRFGERPEWTDVLMAVEPLGQVLFLFLLGYSAWLSLERTADGGRRGWLAKQARRIAGLLLLAMVMVLLERGQWQEPVNLSGGFLGLASKSLLLLLPLGMLPAGRLRVLAGFGMGIALWGASAGLEGLQVWRNGWNAGSGPLLPLAAVAWTGWMAAQWKSGRGWRCMGAGAAWMLLGWLWGGAEPLYAWLDRSGRESVGILVNTGHGPAKVFYYTLHASLALFWVGATLALLELLRRCRGRFWSAWMPLGRYTLLVYLAHLAVLGVLRLRFGLLAGDAFYPLMGGLLLAMFGLAHGRARFALIFRKREGRAL